MPNTLAHFGAQAVLSRAAFSNADYKVIFLGCLLPDMPWIFQRIVNGIFPVVDEYTLRLYCIAQGSLFITLFLCGALAAISNSPGRIFGILAINSVLHLTLDSLQTKWANGVHLVAPVSWEMLNFGLFWPESLPTYLLTLFGLSYVVWVWRQAMNQPLVLPKFSFTNTLSSLALLTLYFVLPIVFLNGPFIEDNHYVRTFIEKENRVGRYIEFDRSPYIKRPNGDVLLAYNNEEYRIQNTSLDHSAIVSVRARFVEPNTLHILEIHENSDWFRDGSTYIALLLLMTLWAATLLRAWNTDGVRAFTHRDPHS